MSLPPRPGRAAPSRHPGGRAMRAAAAALGTLLALAAWVISQAGVAQATSPWPSGHGTRVREVAWIPAPASGTLRPRMQGAAVRRLQQRLAELHYYPGAVNGRFGTDTLEAVWAFKEVQGLPTTAGADDVDPACSGRWPALSCRPCWSPRGVACASRSTCRAKCWSSTSITRWR